MCDYTLYIYIKYSPVLHPEILKYPEILIILKFVIMKTVKSITVKNNESVNPVAVNPATAKPVENVKPANTPTPRLEVTFDSIVKYMSKNITAPFITIGANGFSKKDVTTADGTFVPKNTPLWAIQVFDLRAIGKVSFIVPLTLLTCVKYNQLKTQAEKAKFYKGLHFYCEKLPDTQVVKFYSSSTKLSTSRENLEIIANIK